MKDQKLDSKEFSNHATAHELKSRLNNGEPALTIIDARDSETYRHGRIQGAINVPVENLLKTAESSLEYNRDIYIYGASDAESAEVANMLRQAGFTRVAELQGGVEAFKEIGGSLDGIDTNENAPAPDNYNVVDRMKQFAQEKKIENSMK
mgnify:CR=1 FL=1